MRPTAPPRTSPASSNAGTGPKRDGPAPAFDSAPYDAVPEPNEKFGRDTFGVLLVSKRLEDSDELTTFSISFPNGAFFGAPSNAPNRNEGASRVAAPSRRGAESDESAGAPPPATEAHGFSFPFARAGDAGAFVFAIDPGSSRRDAFAFAAGPTCFACFAFEAIA